MLLCETFRYSLLLRRQHLPSVWHISFDILACHLNYTCQVLLVRTQMGASGINSMHIRKAPFAWSLKINHIRYLFIGHISKLDIYHFLMQNPRQKSRVSNPTISYRIQYCCYITIGSNLQRNIIRIYMRKHKIIFPESYALVGRQTNIKSTEILRICLVHSFFNLYTNNIVYSPVYFLISNSIWNWIVFPFLLQYTLVQSVRCMLTVKLISLRNFYFFAQHASNHTMSVSIYIFYYYFLVT